MSSSTPAESNINSSSSNSDDLAYCHYTARRAVARAALHLGIGTMTAEAVDGLSGCLLEYLERLGATVAATVEASGRTSQHCNTLDAIAATELCTAAAVQAVHAATASDDTAADAPTDGNKAAAAAAATQLTTAANSLHSASWKDLAVFCFGPDWGKDGSGLMDDVSQRGEGGAVLGAGKVGPSSNGAGATAKVNQGWVAPYPDELIAFPVCSATVANPHALTTELALHSPPEDGDGANMQDSEMMVPDAMFALNGSGWGKLGQQQQQEQQGTSAAVGEKRKAGTEQGEDEKQPPKKRVKIAVDEDEDSKPAAVTRRPSLPSYIPSFYPPFPSHLEARTVVDTTTTDGTLVTTKPKKAKVANTKAAGTASNDSATQQQHPTLSIRSALVQLGPYWGSLSNSTSSDDDAVVPAGRPPAAAPAVASSIVPLARASGSLVSRILEGSMDPQ